VSQPTRDESLHPDRSTSNSIDRDAATRPANSPAGDEGRQADDGTQMPTSDASAFVGAAAERFLAAYELLEEIGRGGMGVVYKARNRNLGRVVALKIIQADVSGRALDAGRLVREAKALAQLEHHNIVTVYHAGKDEQFHFIEMQYVDGQPLTRLLQNGPVEVTEASRIIEQVAHALSHAHRKGIVHRDIKPANILLTPDGVVKVVDFGIAKVLDSSTNPAADATMCGTPQYMAPEQWRGQQPNARTDQYCLGVTFYLLLTGRLPFAGDSIAQYEQHLSGSALPAHHVNSAVPEPLGEIVARMMSKDPDARYASCDDLVTALRLLDHRGTPEPHSTQAPPQLVAASAESTPLVPGRANYLVLSLAIGLVVALSMLLASAFGWMDALERSALDLRFAWAPDAAISSPVSVVTIDRESKEKLAPETPLSRERHYGELIVRLAQAGSRAIALDLLMSDRSTRAEDGSLAAMTRMTPTVVHAVNLPVGPAGSTSQPKEDVPARWSLDIPVAGLPEAQSIELPIPELIAAAGRVGHVSLSVDPDGVIRRVPLLLSYAGRCFPSLSLSSVMTALGVESNGVKFSGGDTIELHQSDGKVLRIPVDSHAQMLINFRHPLSFPEASLWQMLDGSEGTEDRALLDRVKGQVVFVGSRLEGDYDVGVIPGTRSAALVYAHALAADSMLRQSFVVPVAPAAAIGILFLSALIPSLVAGLMRPVASLLILCAGIVVYGAACGWLFSADTRTVLPMAAPISGAVTAYAAVALARYWRVEREKRLLAGAFSRYLSPEVTRRILFDPDRLKLGGKRKELTVLCAEIHQFDELSERLEPEEIDELLTQFFANMTEVVFKYEGTLDQFSGQGLRAFFGDPEPQEDHASRAVRCGLEMRGRAAEIVRVWARHGRPPLDVGIGIATGYVTVGNIGSLRRMQYTVVGRPVESAARLARAEPGRVIVSSRTRSMTTQTTHYEARADHSGHAKYFEAIAPRSDA
jgi:adenylate cyclase